jgi:hypothetical protein
VWLINQIEPARNRPWISAQQDTDIVFRLFDRLLKTDDFRFRLFHQRLRLIHIRNRGFTALELYSVELQDFVVGCDRISRVHELAVILAQQKVIAGHGGNQGGLNYALPKLCSQKSGTRRFRGPAVLPPEIDDIVQLQSQSVERGSPRVNRGTLVRDCRRTVQSRKLIGARNPQRSVGLKDTRGGNPHIVVVGEGFLDEALQNLILVHGRPLHFGELFTSWLLRGSIGRNPAILAWDRQRRTLVVGADLTSAQREQ